jgi:ATP-binding cassette subfamily B protein
MLIQQAVARMEHRTVIAVAHRLSTLAAFDRILVMDGGRLVEDGPPAALRARGGLFDRMWRLQSEGMAVEDQPDEALARIGAVEPPATRRRATVGLT